MDRDINDEVVAALRRIARAIELHSRHLLVDHGLTGPQLAVLKAAAALGPVSSGALARSVHLSGATITGILDRLARRGLVERARDEDDRRSVLVTVTDLGRGVLSSQPSLLHAHFRQELGRLADWEQTMILATLQRVASMMEAGVPQRERAEPRTAGMEQSEREIPASPSTVVGLEAEGVSDGLAV